MKDDFEGKIKDFTPNTQKRMREMKGNDKSYDPFKSNRVPMSNKQVKEWGDTVKKALSLEMEWYMRIGTVFCCGTGVAT